jgi:hypothetical protein
VICVLLLCASTPFGALYVARVPYIKNYHRP